MNKKITFALHYLFTISEMSNPPPQISNLLVFLKSIVWNTKRTPFCLSKAPFLFPKLPFGLSRRPSYLSKNNLLLSKNNFEKTKTFLSLPKDNIQLSSIPLR